MDGDKLPLALSARFGAAPVLSDAETAAVHRKLWDLLGRLAINYTGAGSSSVRAETAQALLQSACFLIGLSLGDGAAPAALKKQLIDEDNYEKLFQKGLEAVTSRIETGKALLIKAKETQIKINNAAYTGTTGEVEKFFARYNYCYFAHEIPCMLDYPLAVSVDEKLLGIEYIHAYLSRLILENEFCAGFDARTVRRLVGRVCPDGGLISIYEAVVIQAVALTLIKGDVFSLDVTEGARRAVQSALISDAMRERWLAAAESLCILFDLEDDAKAYLKKTAEEAFIHVRYAAEMGRLDALLPPLHDEREAVYKHVRFIDGEVMDDEKLRMLMDEIASCRHVSDKIAMVKQNVKSMRDFFEVLNICFWGDECGMLFKSLDSAACALLLQRVRIQKQKNPDWRSESGWEENFIDYMKDSPV